MAMARPVAGAPGDFDGEAFLGQRPRRQPPVMELFEDGLSLLGHGHGKTHPVAAQAFIPALAIELQEGAPVILLGQTLQPLLTQVLGKGGAFMALYEVVDLGAVDRLRSAVDGGLQIRVERISQQCLVMPLQQLRAGIDLLEYGLKQGALFFQGLGLHRQAHHQQQRHKDGHDRTHENDTQEGTRHHPPFSLRSKHPGVLEVWHRMGGLPGCPNIPHLEFCLHHLASSGGSQIRRHQSTPPRLAVESFHYRQKGV